jgi:hypothetical protein
MRKQRSGEEAVILIGASVVYGLQLLQNSTIRRHKKKTVAKVSFVEL